MPNDFHFLSPEWFLALLPLAAILWAARRQGVARNAWQRVVDRDLLPYLLMEQAGSARWLPLALVAAGWLVAVIALANPTYERRPVPALRAVDARVVVLDLSQSMEAADLKPSRLARARYKVADILNRSRDGQVGLVVFAGDAFVVAPLSDDANTLLGMLDALSPEVMPVRGSRPDLGLAKAGELLTQAGARGGEVILVGDGAGDERARYAATALAAQGRTLSVIGVGTAEGAPVPGARDADGRPAIARLDPAALQGLASAGGGDYAGLTADGADLERVLHRQPGRVGPDAREDGSREGGGKAESGTRAQADQWQGLGPWVSLVLLPLAALAFRRGWLMGAALTLALTQGTLTPSPALALTWDDLWQRPDQQAAAALARGDNQRALGLAQQPDQRGTASYRLGDYPAAAETFAAAGTADGDYNRGNALALAGRLQEAIAAYEAALTRQPGMEDALYNKAKVEELLKRQEQRKEQQEKPDRQGQSGDPSKGGEGGQPSEARDGKDGQSQDGDQGAQQGQAGNRDRKEGPGGPQDQKGQSSDGAGQAETGNRTPDSGEGQDRPGQEPGEGQPGQGTTAGREDRGDPGKEQAAAGSDQRGPDGSSQQEGKGAGARQEDALRADGAQARQAKAEQAADDYRKEAARQAQAQGQGGGETDRGDEGKAGAAVADDLTPEEREARQAADQWLRRIPDDPSGLLRRKFLYQYRLRTMQHGATTSGDPW